MASVQERIKKLNKLDSGTKAPVPQQHGDINNRRVEPYPISSNEKPYKPVTAQGTNKAHLFKTAKLIQKSFSTDSAERDVPFLSSHKKEQQQKINIPETNSTPNDDRVQIHASLSADDNDDELDAAAAMSYWRSRAKGKQNDRKEAISDSSTRNTATSNEVSLASSTVIKPNIEAKQINNITPLTETDPVVLPHSPPRLQHRKSPQSNFQKDIFGSTNTQMMISKGEEESSIDINVATSASPKSSTNHQYALSPTRQLLSVKSSESVLSAATETSCTSTLSTRAKKFLKEKRKNGQILTGRGITKTNSLTKETKEQNIILEQASKDRLKKKLAALSTPVAVGETADSSKHPRSIPLASNSGELRIRTSQQTKADIPFDEPSKEMLQEISGDASKDDCWDNTSKSSQKSDIIHVTQQYHIDHDGSLSEVTNQSEMNSTTTDSLVSDRGRRTIKQKKSPKAKSSIPHNEGIGESILDTFGALAEDAGCQVLDAFESFANAFKASYEDDDAANRNAATTDAPFDEDVAIEVEYVEKIM